MTTISLGSYIVSKSRFRADDDTLPVGGLVIDSWDGDDDWLTGAYRIVGFYRGAIEYFEITADDAATGSHGGAINPPVIRDVLRGIATDISRGGDPLRHTTAQTVLAGVLSRYTPAKAGH